MVMNRFGTQTSLVEHVRTHGTEQVETLLTEGLYLGLAQPAHADALKPKDLSIRELAEAFCGEEWVDNLGPSRARRRGGVVPLREAGEAVDVTGFSNITGQIVYYQIKEAWETADMIGENLISEEDTVLDGEKIPWVTKILSNGGRVHPGMPYPSFGFAEEWINTVPLDTYGAMVEVHKLTVFYDRTGQVLREANDIGLTLRRNKEFRILDTILGAPNTPLFNWKGVTYSPYQVNGTFWSNLIFSNPMVDWTSFRTVELLASKILEPDLSGAGVNIPIEINLDSILVMPFRQWDLDRIIHATQLAMYNLATAPTSRTESGNVVKSYKPYTSKILYRRAIDALGLSGTPGSGSIAQSSQADELYYMWDSKRRPLVYKRNWPLIVAIAPPNNPEEFTRDIVFQAKASERGNASWEDPRMIFQVRGTPT